MIHGRFFIKTKPWTRILLCLLPGALLLSAVACKKDKDDEINTNDDETQAEAEDESPFVIEDCGDGRGNPGRFHMATRTDRRAYINEENRAISSKVVSYSNMDEYVKEIQKIYMNVKAGNSR